MVGPRCFFLDPPKSFLSKMERKLRGEAHKMNFQKYPSRWTSPPMCWFFFFFLLTCLAFFFLCLSLILSGCVSFLHFFFFFGCSYVYFLINFGWFLFLFPFLFRKQFWVNFLCYFFFALMKCLSIHNFLKV